MSLLNPPFAIAVRGDSDTAIEFYFDCKCVTTLTSRNKVEKETESSLVEGDDLLSLLIPLPCVIHPFFLLTSSFSQSFPYLHLSCFSIFAQTQIGRWDIGEQRSHQRLEKR